MSSYFLVALYPIDPSYRLTNKKHCSIYSASLSVSSGKASRRKPSVRHSDAFTISEPAIRHHHGTKDYLPVLAQGERLLADNGRATLSCPLWIIGVERANHALLKSCYQKVLQFVAELVEILISASCYWYQIYWYNPEELITMYMYTNPFCTCTPRPCELAHMQMAPSLAV